MKLENPGRRDILKLSAAGAVAGVTGLNGQCLARAADGGQQQLRIAGYSYDRVRAIMDGGVGIKGTGIAFTVESIYRANASAFGAERKYEVTEIGLVPFIQKFINEDFRGYTLVPVFISRIFRHRNIFVHTDSGIREPEDLRRIGFEALFDPSTLGLAG